MTRIRLGAVGYLNARPLVYGLDRQSRFDLRYDAPSKCASLLHEHAIDVGLVPSIEYLRGPCSYIIVPGPAVASRGEVRSVALYTRREPRDIRTIAMDTNSRTSVALATILVRRAYGVLPEPVDMAPDLEVMLARADAALMIGDNALLVDHATFGARKIDLGELWAASTGLPFVYAFWTGWPHALSRQDVVLLQEARDAGITRPDEIARAYFPDDPVRQEIGSRYLRDNIRCFLGGAEIEGLTAFYRYAAELNLVSFDGELRIYDANDSAVR